MTYAEPAYRGRDAIQMYRIRHLCYTRMCLSFGFSLYSPEIAEEAESAENPPKPAAFPTKTHLFLVGEFPLLTSYEKPSGDWVPPNWRHSLSSSLPADRTEVTTKRGVAPALLKARELRKRSLNALPLASPPMRDVTGNMQSLQRWPVANCAETLNAIG